MYPATTENTNKARAILEQKIETGRVSAAGLLERIERDVPTDTIVAGRALHFKPNGGVSVQLGECEILGVGHHALRQMSQRAGVPPQYVTELVENDGWQRQLACDILERHYSQSHPESRYLARSVNGTMRGFLSDRYRRLDNRPLVEAFAEECGKVGAVPVDGTYSDTRVALKALLPQVYEPVPGEVLAFGVEWHNSDYGAGAHALRAFMLRVWCLNGATTENVMAQVHLGCRLGDDIDLSEQTYRLDTKTSVSALRDVVRGTLSERKVRQLCEGIKSANDKEIDWKSAQKKVSRRLLKGEIAAAKQAFEGPDVYNLPAGNTAWRASNALSWVAGQTKNPDRKLELERVAGELATGKKDRG